MPDSARIPYTPAATTHPIHSLRPNKTGSLMPLNINAPDLNSSACPHPALPVSPLPTQGCGGVEGRTEKQAYGQCMCSEMFAPCGLHAESQLVELISSLSVLSFHLNGHSVSDSLNTST